MKFLQSRGFWQVTEASGENFRSEAARIERCKCSLQARSLSLQGWGLIDLPLRASNEGLQRPRVARAQKIISLQPFPLPVAAPETISLPPSVL
jgi:hypothetical protein